MSQAAIAERVGIGHSTVSSWLAKGRFPERKPREQGCQLDRYLPDIYERWVGGCHHRTCLFRERVKQGYKGSYASVRDNIVAGIERDKAAVVTGPTLPQNNGLVEGKVNKLKLIKRMGYGRAGFPLLRQRVLHAL